ncbi:MAG: hypothetical protein BMS9Abin21_206 [Thermodesulfovibrionia bacterium]|nr:MAG: hypothetical protein BMS9Abin21_206 [Thermodesulfovibrionia bacterium]
MGNASTKNTIFDTSYQGLKSTGGAGHVDASPDSYDVTRHATTADPNGPFIGLRFDVAGTVSLESGGGGDVHALNVLAGEYWPGTVLRVNIVGTSLADTEIVGFKRA